nr:HAMP domain-containing sensor histidine kinase [uncultured Schaedlerella sp.]
MKDNQKAEYSEFQKKVMLRFCTNAVLSVAAVILLYLFLWKQRGGNLVVWILVRFLHYPHEQAFLVYHNYFRGYKEIFFGAAILLVFIVLLWRLFRWITRYFNEVNQGIDALLAEDTKQVRLSAEMLPFELKLNAVKNTLKMQKQETALAEQRKDELVMYLAHDIRTPLTSVIGYLNLLDEEPDMPAAKRAKSIHITLDKAYRLESMINEFFEITRYNSGQIRLSKEPVDLYYLLVQLSDELSPVFALRGNSVVLDADEDLTVCADPDKLVRVFGNILRNAAAYSYADTEITISAAETKEQVVISFRNKGNHISKENLSSLFDKFYRLDKARISDTGGTGLGLAIAKEIILLHGGSIDACSEHDTITITVRLPKMV